MATDILNRQLQSGDLVIKAISDRSSCRLAIGVISDSGKSLICRAHKMSYTGEHEPSEFKCVTNLLNVHKIENPTEMELKEKEAIIEYMEENNLK